MMPSEWLSASAEAGKWLSEEQHGGWRSTSNPLANKRVAMDVSFEQQTSEQQGGGKPSRMLEALVKASQGCKLVMADLAHPHSFDMVVMGSKATAADRSKWPPGKAIVWDTLLV